MYRPCLALAVLLASASGADAGTIPGFALKDPYIARKEGETILFGGERAKEYLEMLPDGTARVLPADIKRNVDYAAWNSSFGTWLMLASFAVPTIYASLWPDPWKNFSNQNETSWMRGFIILPIFMTYFQWETHRDIVGPFFERTAIRLNKIALEKEQSAPSRKGETEQP